MVQQAYVCGVSTRRVDQLVESLGLRISTSEVSRIAGLLDEQVTAFRQRPLAGRYPYVFVDAKIENVRDGGRVARGLVGVQLAISDAHPGLKTAIARVFDSPWQRCTVHVLSDLRGHCRKDQHDALGALIGQLFTARTGLRRAGAWPTRSFSSSPGCRRSRGCSTRPKRRSGVLRVALRALAQAP